MSRPRMAFISPVFLFPNDAGGKIRTTNILRGLKGGAFDVTLVSPATPEQVRRWRSEIDGVCDEFVPWRPAPVRPRWARAVDLLCRLPVNVVADRTQPGLETVGRVCARRDMDLLVFDFVHSTVLMPPRLQRPSVCFTHNVEAEIFARHAKQAPDRLRRWMWSSQHRKMRHFEAQALRRFECVIAVSARDALFFSQSYGVRVAEAIPTGVDLEFFGWQLPQAPDAGRRPTVVFTGSMDWAANIDGMQFFLGQVWPLVLAGQPDARLVVVGKNPPASLLALARQTRQVEFTGFVDDVRSYVHAAQAFVIPLLVGGGTRIKAFEAMAMGCPVVSTTVGIEGLQAIAGEHYLECDAPSAMADALLKLLRNGDERERLSRAARSLVEQRFGHREASRVFEAICQRALADRVAT